MVLKLYLKNSQSMRNITLKWALLLISVLIYPSFVLAKPDSSLHSFIVSYQFEQIRLLEKLVNINSGTSNISGVRRVGDIMRKELQQLGFKTRWVNEPAVMKRAPTLIATRTGNLGKKLLLIGHLDTVFPSTSPFKKFILNKNTAKGPGIIDDKGGMIVMLYALKALHAKHLLDDSTITIVLTGDEEDSGKPALISRRPLVNAARKVDVALDFEPTITLETASVARRGISHWTIKSHGNESHSATIFLPDVGDGAIFELSRILNEMKNQMKGEKYLTFNPGVLLAGNKIDFDPKKSEGEVFGKPNIVSKVGLVSGDFRFIDDQQKLSFEKKLNEIVSHHLPGTTSEVSFEDGMPAMSPTENNKKLLAFYSQVSQEAGLGEVKELDAGVRGAGDISYVAAIVPYNLAGLGPMGFGTHSVIESIDLASLPIQTERCALLLHGLIHHDFR